MWNKVLKDRKRVLTNSTLKVVCRDEREGGKSRPDGHMQAASKSAASPSPTLPDA